MFFLLYKPKNISSSYFIRKYARENNIKKIGHTGTLDPMAEGLILVATNESLKLIQFLKQNDKTYIVKALFGVQTDTYDITGKIVNQKSVIINNIELNDALNSFLGKSQQIPPIYSAKKINGKKGYELARKNIDFQLSENTIYVHKINLVSFKSNEVTFEIEVSKGTYIRSIVNDLGKKLFTIATMSFLKRSKIGDLDESFLNMELKYNDLFDMDQIELSNDEFKKILNGNNILNRPQFGLDSKIMLTHKNKIVAVGQVKTCEFISPIKVLTIK